MRQNKRLLKLCNKEISIHAPLTGCDGLTFWAVCQQVNFNPRTPYGMRRSTQAKNQLYSWISIHAPLTGCDVRSTLIVWPISIFQSTHPLRDATCTFISIKSSGMYFNPRTPYGMRHKPMTYAYGNANISIHAPLTGCDIRMMATSIIVGKFQSTHPLRDATLCTI